MCGINGFSWEDKELILSMNDKIKHRGPDSNGSFVDDKISLGHVRLSILDLSDAGNQPLFYSKRFGGCSNKCRRQNIKKSKVCIVYNGEIYNFERIKKDLVKLGYKFTSKTDSEVVLASYLEWGEDCVRKFEGMWAFCIYDMEKEVLFFSRDRIGVKPLYYYWKDKKLIFSSEIKAILNHDIKREPNRQVMFDYIYYNFRNHNQNTFFKNIFRVMPGHNMRFDIKRWEIELIKYYDVEEDLKKRVVKDFKGTFLNAISKRLVSDVPVGTCLSGGLDSSAISCSINKLFPKNKLTCFSLVFPGEKFDESYFQNFVIKKCNARHKKSTFDKKDFFKDMDDFVYTHEEPVSSLSFYGQYNVFKLANKNNFKVLLEGQGADEILGGYHWFYAYRYLSLFRKMKFVSFVREVYNYRKNYGNNEPLRIFFAALMPSFVSKFLWRRRMGYVNVAHFSKENMTCVKELHWNAKSVREMSILSEKYTQVPRLLDYGDKNSMRWSVESRVPFCDHDLVNCVINYPDDEKFKNYLTKGILRDSMNGILPKEIIERKDKKGYETPEKKILQSSVIEEDFNRILDSDLLDKYPYVDKDKVKKMLDDHLSNRKNNKTELIKMYFLYRWIERFIENGE
jgi:asparagine synthase (glutamine-hydrolysing)